MLNFIVVFFFCFCGTALNAQEKVDWKTKLQTIEAELQDLKNEQTRYMSTARRLDDKGMSWQSQDETQEAKRAFQKADDLREAAKKLQPRIDALNAQKTKILQEHPEANGSP